MEELRDLACRSLMPERVLAAQGAQRDSGGCAGASSPPPPASSSDDAASDGSDAYAISDRRAAEDEFDLRGFRFVPGGLDAAVAEALTLARADGSRAPLLLLVQGAPPLPQAWPL